MPQDTPRIYVFDWNFNPVHPMDLRLIQRGFLILQVANSSFGIVKRAFMVRKRQGRTIKATGLIMKVDGETWNDVDGFSDMPFTLVFPESFPL